MRELEYCWSFWAREKQLPPDGDWLTWLVETGRGFGKTRTGGEWFHGRMMRLAGRWGALVAKNPADARDFMLEGPGGILKNAAPWERPLFQASKRRVTWPNGSWATIYSSEDADQLRGYSGDTAWLDELAKYKNPREVWDNLAFGMREPSGDQPRKVITTTPRPLPLLEEIEGDPGTVVTKGTSYENRANLSPVWFSKEIIRYEGTELGRQEIHGERLDMVEGRVYSTFDKKPFPAGNVDPTVEDIPGATILVGQDFNVNPMASVIGVRAADQLLVLDALELPVSNTTEVAQEIRRRYPDRHVVVCPDPSGRARKTSAPVGQTDFTILEDHGFEVRADLAAPLVVDRVNNTLAMLGMGEMDGHGRFVGPVLRRVRIHPRATPLIRALRNLQYKTDSSGQSTNVRDKGSGFDHVCDALDYLLWEEFRVLGSASTVHAGTYHM